MNLPIEIAADMICDGDFQFLNSISAELTDSYAKRQIFRTETEARISVLDDIHFPTRAAKYWQAVREQTVMLEQLALLSFDYRRNEVALSKITHRLMKIKDDFEEISANIDLDECIFKRNQMQRVATDRVREIAMWSKIKSELDDGSFDTKNVDTHQLISYTTQFLLRANHANMEQMSAGERDNLAGQLQAAMNRCRDSGLMSTLKAALPDKIRETIK